MKRLLDHIEAIIVATLLTVSLALALRGCLPV